MTADVEPVALRRLRDYASAWRAIGCGCGECGQCDARNLIPDDADAIADEIEALRAEREVIVAEAVKYADKSGRLEAKVERLEEALRIAEAALADIGEADREPGDDVSWCERRAALGLRRVRDTLRDHDKEGKE